jgi:hypothetical protein
MEQEEQRFLIKYLWMENWGPEKITKNSRSHSELIHTAGPKSKYGPRSLSRKDSPHARRRLLTLGPQLAAFRQKYPFVSARVPVQHSLTGVPTIKEILQRELGLKNPRRAGCPIFVPRPKSCHC